MTFAHPSYLWLLLLLAPLLWLAWRARPRRRVTVGSLLLWRRALELRGPAPRARWRRPEVALVAAAAVLGVAALAGPMLARPAAPAALALCDRNYRVNALGEGAGVGGRLRALASQGWQVTVKEGAFSAASSSPITIEMMGTTGADGRAPATTAPADGPATALALAAAARRANPGAAVFWLGDRPPPEGLGATWLPVGASGDNAAICRAEIAGGRPFATVAAFAAAPWRGALAWGLKRGQASGRAALDLSAGEARAVEVVATAADWRAGGGRLALWLEGLPAGDVLAADDALTLEKACVAAIDAGRFPALARALQAAGLELAPPGAAADVAVVAAGAGEGVGARPRLATLAVAPLPAGGAGGDGARDQEGAAAPGAKAIVRAQGGPAGRWLCPPLTEEWIAVPDFPLAVCRWLDGLTPPAGDAAPPEHDCRLALPPAPALAAPAAAARGAGAVSLAPWLAGLAALAALGLAALAWRRPAPVATKPSLTALTGGGR